MIEITLTLDEGLLSLTVSGHSRYDELGKDIVCAGVSAITFSAVNLIRSQGGDIEIDNGYIHCRQSFDTEYARGVYELLSNGYGAIAEQFPDYISFDYGSY